MADDDDESFRGAFEDGHWVWEDSIGALIFLSDLPPEEEQAVTLAIKIPTSVEFKELDLMDQMRFRKRYQRKVKPDEPDVITVQDLKDLALYTAPLAIMTPTLINFLHLSTTERFLRALILYCQYYLQVKEEMAKRMIEAQTKVRTDMCERLESKYREDLCDLRSIVAKEYCTILVGGDDTKKFHHMGALKKRRSLSTKDARDFEAMLQMSIQIVWLALTRRSLNFLELEVNRIFKTEIFNTVEHTLKTGYLGKCTPEERSVLLGNCVHQRSKLTIRSPLGDEVFCDRSIDFRAMGLGVIKYENLYPRLEYILWALAAPEDELIAKGVTVGILGLPRSYFDTTLRVLPTVMEEATATKSTIMASSSLKSTASMPSGTSKSGQFKKEKEVKWVYADVVLPIKDQNEPKYPPYFPAAPAEITPSSEVQRQVWQLRLYRIHHPPKRRRKSTFGTEF